MKKLTFVSLAASFFLFILSNTLFAQTKYYWTPHFGNTSAKVKDNWSTGTCGGSAATTLPASTDTIIFDCDDGNCSLDTNFNVAGFRTTSSYSGTITLGSTRTLTVKYARFIGGTFNGNSGTMQTDKYLLIDGASFTSTSGNLTVSSYFEKKSGSFTHNSGTVIFKDGAGVLSTTTLTIAGTNSTSTITLYDVELNPSSSNTIYDLKNLNLIIEHDLDLDGSNQLFINTASSSVIHAEGDITSSNTNTTGGGTSTIIIDGDGNQDLIDNNGTTETGKLPNIKIDKDNGTLTLDGNIALGGSTTWEYVDGDVDEGDANILCYYTNTLKNSSGAAMEFYAVDFYGTGNRHTIVNTVTILNLMHTSQTGVCTIQGDTIEVKGNIDWDNSSSFSISTAKIKFTGTNSQTLSGDYVLPLDKVFVRKTSGDITLQKEVIVTTTIKFTSGYLVSDTINILTLRDNATASHASNSSFVKGPVKKIGNDAFTFPVGKGGYYKPIGINAPSSTSDAFRAEYFNAEQTFSHSMDSLTYISSCEYWNLKRTAGSSSIKPKLYWDANTCDIYTLSTLRVGRWNGSLWTNLGPVTTSGNTTSGSMETNSSQSTFGNFAICKRSPVVYAHAGNDVSICDSSNTTIGGSPSATGGLTPYSYSWSPSTGLSSATAANPIATPHETTSYILRVTDLDHSVSQDTVVITVWPKPVADAGVDRLICAGTFTPIGGGPTASDGTIPYTFEWMIDDSLFASFGNPSVSPEESTEYILYLSDAHECADTDSVYIFVDPPLIADAGLDTLLTLDDGAVTLGGDPTVSGGTPPYSYHWLPETDLDDARIDNPLCTTVVSHYYLLQITDSVGCHASDDVLVSMSLPAKDELATNGLLSGDSVVVQATVNVTGDAGADVWLSSYVAASGSENINNEYSDAALDDLDDFMDALYDLPSEEIGRDLSDETYTMGVYYIDSSAVLYDTLTLSGTSGAYFIFNIRDSLIVTGDTAVIMLDGIEPNQVFFNVMKKIHVISTTVLNGNIMAGEKMYGDTIAGRMALFSKQKIALKKIYWDDGCPCALELVQPLGVFHSYLPNLATVSKSLDADDDGEQDFLGYNVQNTRNQHGIFIDPNELFSELGGWNDFGLHHYLPMLQSRLFRWHQGQGDWDWNAGQHFGYELFKYQDPVQLFDCEDRLNCVDFDLTPNDENVSNKMTDFNFGLQGMDASAMPSFSMIGGNLNYNLKWMEYMLALKHDLKYVELGNELYLDGGKAKCAYSSAFDYLQEANTYLDAIHDDSDFDNVKVGVIAASPGLADPDLVDQNAPPCREAIWNAVMSLPNATTNDQDPNYDNWLHLDEGDALCFHLYPESGLCYPCSTAFDTKIPIKEFNNIMLRKPFNIISHFREEQAKVIPEGADAWITEFNLTDNQAYTAGTWAHGLFMASWCLAWMEVEEVKHITVQTITGVGKHSALFTSYYDFNFTEAPDELQSNVDQITFPWTLTAEGHTQRLIGEAMRYNTRATQIIFPEGVPVVNEDEPIKYPELYGWKFDNPDVTTAHQVVIVNLGDQGQTIDLSNLIQGELRYDRIQAPEVTLTGSTFIDPFVYIVGGNATAYYDEIGDYKKGPTLGDPSLPYLPIENLSVNNNYIFLPPFSIVRIYQVLDEPVVCDDPLFDVCKTTFGAGKPVVGQSVNLYADGFSEYNWTCPECSLMDGLVMTSEPSASSVMVSFSEEGTFTFYPNAQESSESVDITFVAGPELDAMPSSGTYAPSSGSGVNLTASENNMEFWWSPTQALYTNPTGTTTIINNSGNSTSVYARPVESTTYTVTAIDANGCFATAEATVTVNETITGASANYCRYDDLTGEDIILTAPVVAGATYAWLNETNSIAISGTSNVVTISPSDAGYPTSPSLISVEIDDGVPFKLFQEVRVHPSIFIEPFEFKACDGIEFRLTAQGFINKNELNEGTYEDYEWTGSFTDNNKVIDITPSGFATINETVEFTVDQNSNDYPNDCQGINIANEISIAVPVEGTEPSFSITGGTTYTIFEGCEVTFTANPASDYYFSWLPGEGLDLVTGFEVNASPDLPGDHVYTVYGIDIDPNEFGCCSNPLEITVSVLYDPVATCGILPCEACLGNGLDIITGTYSGADYQWYDGSGPITGATNDTYNTEAGGNFYCEVTLANGCSAISNTVHVVECEMRLMDETNALSEGLSAMVFPNPATDEITVKISEAPEGSTAQLQWMDMCGKSLYRYAPLSFDNQLITTLSVPSQLQSGIYLLRIDVNNAIIIDKLVLSK